MYRWIPRTRAWRCAGVLLAALAVVANAVPAFATRRTGADARPLAVSVPSEAASLAPGTSGTIPIRIVNPGSAPVTVRIAGHGVRFGDDGQVTIAGRDARWAGRVDFPVQPLAIAARSYREVGLRVRTPAHISPDLYFVGFVVTPLPNRAASVTYVNQIGSYVTIDIPGPRTRILAADLHVPHFSFATGVSATLHIHNVGRAAVVYWGENDTMATPGTSTPRQQRINGSLLPIGRSRAIVVSAKPSFLVSNVTIRIHIFYPGRTAATTRELTLTKHVVVVQPAALVLLCGVVGGGFVVFLMRRRKRRRRARRRANAGVAQRRSGSSPRRVPAGANAAIRVDRMLAETRAQWTRG